MSKNNIRSREAAEKENHPQKHVLVDHGGNPAFGFVARKTELFDPLLGRHVRYVSPAAYVTRQGRLCLKQRAQVLFVGSDLWHEARYVFARPLPNDTERVPLLKALRVFSHQHWWVSASGAVERRATFYEERMPELPPREGWKLETSATVAHLFGYSKETTGAFPVESQTDRERRANDATRAHHRRLAHAQRTLARHERALAARQKIVDEWQARVIALSDHLLAEPNRSAHNAGRAGRGGAFVNGVWVWATR